LHNILRFLALRMDAHAQLEIREYATAMHDLIASIVPLTMEAWRDYEFEAMHLTHLQQARTGGVGCQGRSAWAAPGVMAVCHNVPNRATSNV
jgi:thymidylate synthase (FAD)